MIDSNLREQLLSKFDLLPVDQQRRVLEFALNLPESAAGPLRGTPGRDLLPFAGVISAAEAEAMTLAIKEGCEQIDPDE